jgi:signal transduction histidine kinase
MFPPEAQTWVLFLDGLKMQQVIVNLIDNAFIHGQKEQVIHITVEKNDDEYICIRVVDSGKGIDSKNLRKVFEPFFTTSRSGTGLGLSIVNHIVKNHGGNVSIRNNDPPPGVTVMIRLPLAELSAHSH